MKKTIVIPTDFTIQSLNVLKTILNSNSDKQTYDFILLHGLSLGDSIRDLLFYSKNRQIEALMSPEFKEAYKVIQNKFSSQINSIRLDLFSGFTLSAFNSYLEANNVNQVCVSELKPEFINKSSFDLTPFIRKCQSEVIAVETGASNYTFEKEIAEVFINQVSVG